MGTLDFPVLFEDNHIIVAVKPPGVLSQADGTPAPDMLSLIKEYLKEKYDKPGRVFLGLVHRLDRPTGGVMVFAKTSKAAARLAKSVQTHAFEKSYACVVFGDLPKRGEWTDYLKKDEAERKSAVVAENTPGAKKAQLAFALLAKKGGYSLADVRLLTGRHHQIRVQFAHHGFPLAGDHKYGGATGKSELALFARSLSFPHPITKAVMTFTAPLPNFDPFNRFSILAVQRDEFDALQRL